MIVVAGHATRINGKLYEAPVNTLVEELSAKGKDFIFIRHYIDGSSKSEIYIYSNGRVVKESTYPHLVKVAPLRYIYEPIATLFILPRLVKGQNTVNFIGVDPLNALGGYVLKKLGKVRKSIFFAADYSTERFSNKLLNAVYLKIDKFVSLNSDQVWNVSQRILDVRKSQGVNSGKNIYVPNVPSQDYKKFVSNNKDENIIVSVGSLTSNIDYEGIIKAVGVLKDNNPNVRLRLVGSGAEEQRLKELVSHLGLDNYVEFLGHTTHDGALETISKSGIGVALYNGQWGFNYYGDSMKCREYFCYGLPAVTTDTHSTVEDIRAYKCGVVSDQTPQGYVKAVLDIWENYNIYSKKAYELNKKFDGVHSKVLEEAER